MRPLPDTCALRKVFGVGTARIETPFPSHTAIIGRSRFGADLLVVLCTPSFSIQHPSSMHADLSPHEGLVFLDECAVEQCCKLTHIVTGECVELELGPYALAFESDGFGYLVKTGEAGEPETPLEDIFTQQLATTGHGEQVALRLRPEGPPPTFSIPAWRMPSSTSGGSICGSARHDSSTSCPSRCFASRGPAFGCSSPSSASTTP